MGKRTTRRRMRGGLFGFGESSTTQAVDNSTTPVGDNSNSIVSGWGDYFKKLGQSASSSFGTGTQPQSTPIFGQGQGGRRRKKMRGGDFSPNSAFSNAMEVQNIQMASPQTLVGGRRRRRKSSRRSRRHR